MSSGDRLQHVIVHYTDPSVPGGVETVIGDFTELVVSRGGRVRILAGVGSYASRNNVEVIHEPILDANGPLAREATEALGQGRRGLVRIMRLATMVGGRLAELLPPDSVWHLHNIATNTLNLPLTCALRRLVEHLPRPQAWAWTWDIRWMDIVPGNRVWLRDIIASAWPNTHYLVASAQRQDVLRGAGYPRERVHLSRPPVNFARVLGLTDRVAKFAEAANILAADCVVLYPCRLSERKSITTAVSAIKWLRAAGHDARLIVTGFPSPHRPAHSRDYVHALRREVAESCLGAAVTFTYLDLDGTTATDMSAFFRLVDVVLITSREEGFGLAALESSMADVPILVSPTVAATTATLVSMSAYAAYDTPSDIAATLMRLAERRIARRALAATLTGAELLTTIEAALSSFEKCPPSRLERE